MVLLTSVNHQDLLDLYYLQTKNGLWHTVPDDGYIHNHLTWHLEEADRSNDIHILLQEVTATGRNGWYEACNFLGKRQQFVEDIERAWRLAEKMYCKESLKAIPSVAILRQSIGLQMRYALIFSTLHDSKLNIPAALIADLVRYKKWSVPQALDYAHRSNDPDVLHVLAVYLPPRSPAEALRGLNNISDVADRANILIKLAASLPDSLWPEVLEISCSSYYYRTNVLKELVAHLPENMFPKVLEIIRNFFPSSDGAEVIAGVAAHLPAHLWPEVFELACKIPHASFSVKVLKSISAYLPKTLFPQLVKTIHEIQSDAAKIEIVVEMVTYLPKDLWPEILAIASNIEPERRANILGGISTHLPKDLFPQAIEMMREIQYDSKSFTSQNIKIVRGISESIERIATYSPKELLPQLLEIARDLPYEYDRAIALMGLMTYLPTASEALETARHIYSESARAKALSKFVIDRPELLPEVLRLVSLIKGADRFKILHELVICLPKEISNNLLLDLLVMASEIENRSNRVNTIIKLAAHLPEELLIEALEITQKSSAETNNEFFRAFSLAGLAVHLTENMLISAIKIASKFKEEENKSVALVGLVRYLPENLLSELFLIIQRFKNVNCQVSTLRKLVDYWPEDLRLKALSLELKALSLDGIQDEDCQLEVLCGLDNFLRNDDFKLITGIPIESNLTNERKNIISQKEALSYLDEAKGKYDCSARAALLDAVAYFPKNLLLETLNLAAKIYWLSSFFPVVVPRLPGRLLPEALKMARDTRDEYEKIQLFITLLSHPSKSLVPENLSSEAFAGLRNIQDKDNQITALIGLVPYLSGDLLTEAFETIKNIQDRNDRIKALISLMPYLPNNLLTEVFEIAQNIQPEYEQAKIFSVAISQINLISIDFSFWSKMLHILAWRDRVEFLQDIPKLAPITVHLSDRVILELIAQNIYEVCQQWP
jgi:hypothetical protein